MRERTVRTVRTVPVDIFISWCISTTQWKQRLSLHTSSFLSYLAIAAIQFPFFSSAEVST